MTSLSPPSVSNANKAHAGAASVVFSEAVAQIIIRAINTKWPGWLDDITAQSVSTVVVALITWTSIYFTPPGER